ncbi:hypothetical protein QHH11_29220, partial [Aphanizomenon sp. PH219]|nr:hypothetical protein [Aphanizomenon sp. PH219]
TDIQLSVDDTDQITRKLNSERRINLYLSVFICVAYGKPLTRLHLWLIISYYFACCNISPHLYFN